MLSEYRTGDSTAGWLLCGRSWFISRFHQFVVLVYTLLLLRLLAAAAAATAITASAWRFFVADVLC